MSRRRQWHPTPVLLPGKSHGRRSLVGCSPWGHSESDTTERLHFHFLLSCIGEGNGNPLQCSCVENPRDRGAWWAAVSGVAQSQTRLKRLSSSSSRYMSGASQVVLVVKNLPANAGDVRDAGSISELGRSPEGGHGNPVQGSCLEDPMDRRTWWAAVCGVEKNWTWLSDWVHRCMSSNTELCVKCSLNSIVMSSFSGNSCSLIFIYVPAETKLQLFLYISLYLLFQ